MRAGTELDNLLEVAQFIGNEADDGRHPEAVRGWDKYKTYFTFDGEIFFEGEISIELIKRGDLFYDITKIKDTSIARAAGTANAGNSSASNRDVFTDNISQIAGFVNPDLLHRRRFIRRRLSRRRFDPAYATTLIDCTTFSAICKKVTSQNKGFVDLSGKTAVAWHSRRSQNNALARHCIRYLICYFLLCFYNIYHISGLLGAIFALDSVIFARVVQFLHWG